MLTSNIKFQSFKNKNKNKNKITTNIFKDIKKQFDNKRDLFLQSLSVNYKNSFNINNLKKYKKFNLYSIIGMGGSSLGAKAIYSFLNDRIKKKFKFVDNIDTQKKYSADKKLNIVISKSGNTLETIVNLNTKKDIKNSIFITESNNNYLRKIAKEIDKEIFEHRNYISGRYSVLSETGMLPACLMGLDPKKFKRIDYLIKDKKFQNQLIYNVSSILDFHNKKKQIQLF